MSKPNSQFIVSIETECLTAVPSNPDMADHAMCGFLQKLAHHAPSLTATSGVFNGYAKVYADCGHIEFAMVECDSPYTAALIFERLQILTARALADLSDNGIELVLANNNHSGLLRDGCNVWGTHENYLSDRHPSTFNDEILPFLVTRIYGGSGGVHYPSGNFLASVRSTCMNRAFGGGTTESRAIHSLARDEHHMGRAPSRYRYHLLLGDGHRSMVNLALVLGSTALVVKAVAFDKKLRAQAASLRGKFSGDWLTTLREVNVLSRGGQPPQVHPLVIETQRIYLEAARRVAAAMDAPPDWIPRLLADWEATLLAYEHQDRTWLAQHMDTFAKYEFYSAVLSDRGTSWAELPQSPELFHELALLDQSYHEFGSADSVFTQLEKSGMLDHRVGPRIEPGQEAEPYIPEVATRARPRALFIRDHRDRSEFEIDWSFIRDRRKHRHVCLDDPFAQDLGEWVLATTRPRPITHAVSEQHLLTEVLRVFDHGRYEDAHMLLLRAEVFCDLEGDNLSREILRHKAWLSARCGFADSEELLNLIYPDPPHTLSGITDYCCVYRFTGLRPNLDAMQPWIERGQAVLQAGRTTAADIERTSVFREHAAIALTHHGRTDEAMALLTPLLADLAHERMSIRMRAQLLATLGETYRRMGRVPEARRLLRQAMQMQIDHEHIGYLSHCTWASLAKSEARPALGIRWLHRAKTVQQRNRDRVGLVTTLLLESRLTDDDTLVEANKAQVLTIRNELPALCQCPLFDRIIDHWDAWSDPDQIDREQQDFWGL